MIALKQQLLTIKRLYLVRPVDSPKAMEEYLHKSNFQYANVVLLLGVEEYISMPGLPT